MAILIATVIALIALSGVLVWRLSVVRLKLEAHQRELNEYRRRLEDELKRKQQLYQWLVDYAVTQGAEFELTDSKSVQVIFREVDHAEQRR
jgi:hypothetical protein